MTPMVILNLALSLPVLAGIVQFLGWSITSGTAGAQRDPSPAPALATATPSFGIN